MSAASASVAPPRLVTAAPVRSLVPVLALQEARRLMRHPVTVLGFAIYVVATVSTVIVDQGPRSAFETVGMVLTFYPGVLMILAGTLLATRDLRAGSGEVLGPLPGRHEERVKAMALASFAPALVGLAANVTLHVCYLAWDRYAAVPDGVPEVWHLLGAPVTILGACLFGIMLGTWAPSRVTAVIGLVGMVVATLFVESRPDIRLLSPALGWAEWGLYPSDWAGLVPGSPSMHVLYLLGLCGMAAAAAWVRVADRRTAPVVLGLVSLATAVAAGLLQMP